MYSVIPTTVPWGLCHWGWGSSLFSFSQTWDSSCRPSSSRWWVRYWRSQGRRINPRWAKCYLLFLGFEPQLGLALPHWHISNNIVGINNSWFKLSLHDCRSLANNSDKLSFHNLIFLRYSVSMMLTKSSFLTVRSSLNCGYFCKNYSFE